MCQRPANKCSLLVFVITSLPLYYLIFNLPFLSFALGCKIQFFSLFTFKHIECTILTFILSLFQPQSTQWFVFHWNDFCTSADPTGATRCLPTFLKLKYLLTLHVKQQLDQGAFIGYILPVLVFSTCYNFPKFLEFTTIHHPNRSLALSSPSYLFSQVHENQFFGNIFSLYDPRRLRAEMFILKKSS